MPATCRGSIIFVLQYHYTAGHFASGVSLIIIIIAAQRGNQGFTFKIGRHQVTAALKFLGGKWGKYIFRETGKLWYWGVSLSYHHHDYCTPPPFSWLLPIMLNHTCSSTHTWSLMRIHRATYNSVGYVPDVLCAQDMRQDTMSSILRGSHLWDLHVVGEQGVLGFKIRSIHHHFPASSCLLSFSLLFLPTEKHMGTRGGFRVT